MKCRFNFGIFLLGLTSTIVASDAYGSRKSLTSRGGGGVPRMHFVDKFEIRRYFTHRKDHRELSWYFLHSNKQRFRTHIHWHRFFHPIHTLGHICESKVLSSFVLWHEAMTEKKFLISKIKIFFSVLIKMCYATNFNLKAASIGFQKLLV